MTTEYTEVFSWMWGALRVDAGKAQKLVASRKRRNIAVVGYDPARFGVYVNKEHLDRIARPFEPGIVGTFRFWDKKERRSIRQKLVIDGSHRATLCLKDGVKFYCHVLSIKESESVTLFNALAKGDTRR